MNSQYYYTPYRERVNPWPYVVVQFNNGLAKVWKDYGIAWGSTAYTVVDYFDNRRDALTCAKRINHA